MSFKQRGKCHTANLKSYTVEKEAKLYGRDELLCLNQPGLCGHFEAYIA